ncbi:hypothetical protein Val02_69910 [Virgisporangium aliadipatigenens]|uniref:Uncharacterized protein n=1 Tax=Virgisporangium aliadipatigenens TaxID=741659 RepID=A0A8J3YUK1_9ACTN|nr:hypothetical protein [Virgisporangium aliadipatigenens]GIJ50105.1 hypothetical protein Val02_69910 [Virgisporangium aliadipatigenens]
MSVDLTKPDAAPPPTPPTPFVLPPWVDPVLSWAGLVVATGLALLTGLFEAFLTPVQWNGWRIPVSLVAALVLNPAIVWFTWVTTRRKAAALLPALVWIAVLFVAGTQTAEGDLVVTGPEHNWVGVATMTVGSVAFAVAGYKLILTGLPPIRSEPKAGPEASS